MTLKSAQVKLVLNKSVSNSNEKEYPFAHQLYRLSREECHNDCLRHWPATSIAVRKDATLGRVDFIVTFDYGS